MKRSQVKINLVVIFIYLILALIFDYVLFKYHLVWGSNDAKFHIGRINEWLAAPTGGFPFLSTHSQSAVGSQVNVFYPSQMLQPLIILIKVFQHPVTCLFIYATLLSVLTAILTDYAVFSVIKDRQLSFLTAVLYTFSAYRMMDFYQQFDLGEFIALTFLPLVFTGFYHMVKHHNEKWQIVFGLTGMLFSHVVLTFLAILFLVALFLLALLRSSKRQQLLGDGILLGVCTLALSSVFWLPMISHQLTTISGLEPTYWKESVVTTNSLSVIGQNLLRNRILYFHTPGTFLTFSGLIVSVSIFIHYRKMNSLWMTTALLFILTLWLITPLFPWSFFKNTIIVVIQMASRFSAFATFFASGLVAYGITRVCNNIQGRQIFYFLTIILACGMTLSSIQDVANEYTANQIPVVTNQNFRQFSAIDHRQESFDYFPHKSRPFVSELSESTAIINGIAQKIVGQSQFNAIKYHIITTQSRNNQLDLPFLNYNRTYYQVKVNGKKVPFQISRRGTFLIKTNQRDNQIQIAYRPSMIDRYSWLISAITLIILMGYYWFLKSKPKSRRELSKLVKA